MGICSSCLGLGQQESHFEPSDGTHLLADPYPPLYGSLNADQRQNPQVDPEEIRRQRDALERLCAQTSEQLIDVTQPTNVDEGSKLTNDYTRLFAERFASLNTAEGSRPSSERTMTGEDEITWLARILQQEQGTDCLKWQTVGEPGVLSMQFDEVLGFESGSDDRDRKVS